jgi:hypothetical protein
LFSVLERGEWEVSEREGLILVTRGDLELTCGARRDGKMDNTPFDVAEFLPLLDSSIIM